MKLALLKLILGFLASLGIYLPSASVYLCAPGQNPWHSAPTSCERVSR